MPSNLTNEQWQRIEAALFAGKKIEAIKLYRDFTGSDLRESKESVEAYEAKLRAEFPDRFTAAPPIKIGCSSKAAIVLLLLIAGVATLLVIA
jgi:hypothetical protein